MYFQFKSLQPDPFSVVVQADPVYAVMYNWEWCFNDRPNRLHTCFAWLGHGSFVTKSSVSGFLSAISQQSIPSDSVALADNFFTTSLNREPNVLVTSQIIGLPLSDRGFSDGAAGLERNRVYIQRGVETLSKLLQSGLALGMSSNPDGIHGGMIRAAEQKDRVFLMTNVESFPGGRPSFKKFEHGLAGWEDQLGVTGFGLGRARGQTRNFKSRTDWAQREKDFTASSYAAAMDGNNSTSWISPELVKKDDWVGIGWIDPPIINQSQIIEVHFIASDPEIFETDQVMEISKITDKEGAGRPTWQRLDIKNLHDTLNPGFDDKEVEEMKCLLIASNDRKFDCVVRVPNVKILKDSFGVRIRKLSGFNQRWRIWECFVVAINDPRDSI